MAAEQVQRRLELLKLCHHHSLEVPRVIERARALEQWMLGEPPVPADAALQRAEALLTGTPQGSV